MANGPVAAIAWGAFWAIIADSGAVDGLAGRKAFAEARTAGCTASAADTVEGAETEGAETGASVEGVAASATVADGPAAPAASGAAKCGITGS